MIEIKEKKTIFVDADNTLINSSERICAMYNEDFKYYDGFKPANWIDVNEWNFQDQCPLMSKEVMEYYFNQKRFFEHLKFMDNAFEYIDKLHKKYHIAICSLGWSQNLKFKEEFFRTNLQYGNKFLYDRFIGCNFNQVNDKSHINMFGGIIVDDNEKMLETSSADIKIAFGETAGWNSSWQGKRCVNWRDVYDYLIGGDQYSK